MSEARTTVEINQKIECNLHYPQPEGLGISNKLLSIAYQMASESQGVSPAKRRRTAGAKVPAGAADVETLRELEGLGKDVMISSMRLACLEVGRRD